MLARGGEGLGLEGEGNDEGTGQRAESGKFAPDQNPQKQASAFLFRIDRHGLVRNCKTASHA